jgi:hypothetical protein
MKKAILMAFAAALTMTACENPVVEDSVEANESETTQNQTGSKKFTFTVKGDFGAAVFTRGYLQADGKDMTDLWVLDYMDGQCVQALHQTPEDATWGSPQMSLAYGQHHVYFVASRGVEPSINETDHIISWGTVRDTFWKDYEVNVVATSNGNRAVTLDRVATKLRVVVEDEVPASCKSVDVTPNMWYYGLDYVSGAAVSAQKKAVSVAVPESLVGTVGQLAVNVFGISEANEWTTSVALDARDGNGGSVGHATISGAPFKRNRATEYSGSLFASGGVLDVGVNGEWENSVVGTW